MIKCCFVLITLGILSHCAQPANEAGIKTDENGVAILSDSVVENIVRRSYQYVALYNVNNKWAMGLWTAWLREHGTRG